MTDGLRERRKTATRRALQEAAVALFAERGFAGTTIDDICDRAEVARRTFFRYFTSKEAVLLDRVRLDIEAVAKTVRTAAAETEPLAGVLARAVDAVTGDQAEAASFVEVILDTSELRAIYLGMLASSEDALRVLIAPRLGVEETHPRARLVAAAAVTGYRVGMQVWLGKPTPRPDLRQILRETVTTMVTPLLP